MKQGKIYNKLIMALLLIAILCYMGYAVLQALREPMTTVQAIEYGAGAGCHSTGYVVRDETVLTSPYAITVLNRREGEKVGAGQTVATGYLTADAQDRQTQIEALSAQLQQLQYAYSYDLDLSDTASLDNEITTELAACAQYVARCDLASVSDMSPKLKGLLLRRSTDEQDLIDIHSQMENLRAQMEQLRADAGADTMVITAPVSGYFSGTADGLESVLTPARLSSLTVSELDRIAADTVSADACGRLIRSSAWYFVCAVDSSYLSDVENGDTVSVSFSNDFYATIDMRISRIGEEEDGQRLLVLGSSDYIQDVTLLREQTADIVFTSYTGLRVPKAALRMDDENQPGVFILESATEKWKPVTILYDNGESYVVALDKSSTNNLWPGDEIIVDGEDLYDGKVVSQP